MNEVSLPVMRQRLAVLREAYDRCSYYDSYPSVVRCRQELQPSIDRLAKRIAELEEQDNAA